MNNDSYIEIDTSLQQIIHADWAWQYHIIPKKVLKDSIIFYAEDGAWDDSLLNELQVLLGKNIEIELINSTIIKQTLGRYYQKTNHKSNNTIAEYREGIKEDFIFSLIDEAYNSNSSDIHIETYEEKCRMRLRIDGKLVEKYVLSRNDYPALINKIKIKAHLDIAEKRLPQDGRILFNGRGKSFDIRVSVLPTLHGEKIVMRLLNKDATNIDVEKLGMSKNQLSNFLLSIKKTHGIILISGPTGSGKTTTLYATLKILNNHKTNILTIEDPVEYTLEGINQVQVKDDIGLSFSEALRSFLRQDPDVIMLGEIRDNKTAQMAIRAALTGHLVLSTIHTNSAWGTVSRLIDMGVPAYLLAGTLIMTAAQRLVRLLCENCKQSEKFDISLLPPGYHAPHTIENHSIAVGCESCRYTGYKGRKAVYEIIPVDNDLSEMIKNGEHNIDEMLKKRNIERMMDQAYALLEKEQTSLDEIYSLLMSSY